jgi:hypothetical protein
LGFLRKLLGFNSNEELTRQVKRRFGVTSKKSLVDLIFAFGGAILNYPDGSTKWKNDAIKIGNEYIKANSVDALISSSSPVTSHLIANLLRNQYEIPWIADLRDLWSQNHYYPYGFVRKCIDERLELKTLFSADVLVTVSEPWAEKLGALHHKEKSTFTITNGFDSLKIKDEDQYNLTSKFTITYTGSVYLNKQDPSKLFAALRALISDGSINPNQVEVRFYGFKEQWLAKEIEQYHLAGVAKQYSIVPWEIALKKQRESQILLLLNWEDLKEKGCYPLKVFEYLFSKRPILSVGGSGDDVVGKLLNETGAGFYTSTIEEIKTVISTLYAEYQDKGSIKYNGNLSKINKYSFYEKAKMFSDILNSCV